MTTGLTPYNTNANSNTGSVPTFASEGILAKDLNNVIRDMQARLRQHAEAVGWFNFGHTPTYTNAQTFTVPGDLTDVYVTGIRLKVSLTGKVVFCTVKKSEIASNTTKITVVESVLDNTMNEVYVGVSPQIVNNVAGTSGLCISTATNNGNEIELTPYSGYLETDPVRGQILSFYATSNNKGSVKINGKDLKYITSDTKTDMKQNYIRLGKYYEVQWDGTDWVIIKGLLTGSAAAGISLRATLDNGKFFTRKANGDLPTGITADKVWTLDEQKAGGAQPTGDVYVELPIGTVTFKDVAGDSSSNFDASSYTYNGRTWWGGFIIRSRPGSGGTLKDSAGTGLFASASAVKANDGITSYSDVLPSETRTIIVQTQEDQVYDYTIGKLAPRSNVTIQYNYTQSGSSVTTYRNFTRHNQAGQNDGYIIFSY